jgi:hypothetical protein
MTIKVRAADTGGDGLPPNEPPDVALLRRVGNDFGQEIVGPPLAPTGS